MERRKKREKVIVCLSAQLDANRLPNPLVPRLTPLARPVKLQRSLGAQLTANRLPNQIAPIQWNPLVPLPAPLAPLRQQQQRKYPAYILVEQPRREGFQNRRWLVEVEEPEDIPAESVRPVNAAKRRSPPSPPPSQDECGRAARVS